MMDVSFTALLVELYFSDELNDPFTQNIIKETKEMKTKLTFLLAFNFLFLFSGISLVILVMRRGTLT
jgi:hypothetical protein